MHWGAIKTSYQMGGCALPKAKEKAAGCRSVRHKMLRCPSNQLTIFGELRVRPGGSIGMAPGRLLFRNPMRAAPGRCHGRSAQAGVRAQAPLVRRPDIKEKGMERCRSSCICVAQPPAASRLLLVTAARPTVCVKNALPLLKQAGAGAGQASAGGRWLAASWRLRLRRASASADWAAPPPAGRMEEASWQMLTQMCNRHERLLKAKETRYISVWRPGVEGEAKSHHMFGQHIAFSSGTTQPVGQVGLLDSLMPESRLSSLWGPAMTAGCDRWRR